MKNLHIASFLLFASYLVLSSCTGVKINTEYDSAINFRGYKYYSICDPDLLISYDGIDTNKKEEIKNNFINAVQYEMNKYYQVNDAKAELKFGFNFKIQDKKQIYRICERPDGIHQWPYCHLDSVVYKEGTLLLFIADIKKNQVIWQSTINGIINEDDLNNKKLIDQTINKIFKDYPINNKINISQPS